MKKTNLLNAPLSAAIAKMGHTDSLVVCDCGLPIPAGPERIDLALVRGTPSFMETFKAVASELAIERIVIAREMKQVSPAFHAAFMAEVKALAAEQKAPIAVEEIDHVDFKKTTGASRAIVRTGECTSYANVLIYAGVAF
jgi:D-ribose pyranase